MPDVRTNRPYEEEVTRLLTERGLSIRALARLVGVTDAHLSRVLRHANYKTVSADLARRTAIALDLPDEYFAEAREGAVFDLIRNDPRLRDQLYDQLHSKNG